MLKERINAKELEYVTGGTYGETFRLVLLLAGKDHGMFLSKEGEFDYEGMKRCFASKGYKFIPSENEPNMFVDRQGLQYGQDYIEDLILDNKL